MTSNRIQKTSSKKTRKEIRKDEKLKRKRSMQASEPSGSSTTQDVIDSSRNDTEEHDSPQITGDSGYKAENLHLVLKRMKRNRAPKALPHQTFLSFKKHIEEDLMWRWRRIPPLTAVPAYKWCENLESFLEQYEHSHAVLTTENYQDADFEYNKVSWKRWFKFRGEENLKKAFKILDETVVDYLRARGLVACLDHINPLTVRDVWMQANSMTRMCVAERFGGYFAECFKFWGSIELAAPEIAFNQYLYHMNNTYDRTFVIFMESLGFPAYKFWERWRNTQTEQLFMQTLDRFHIEFRKEDPAKRDFKGTTTFITKLAQIVSENLEK
ncbi:hypothetical protein OXX69_004517 [Metschnikowia pulcherrima]